MRAVDVQTYARAHGPADARAVADADRAPDAAADEATSRKHRAGETHTYEADQDGDLNLQLTMVSFADARAKKGETYVVYAAADDGAVARVYNSVAQWIAYQTSNLGVAGSSPVGVGG